MSHRATNWAFQQRGLKPSAKIVLLILADCHNPSNGCFPTQAFLADACEMNRDTVNVQLARLEELGLIRRVRSIDPSTKRQRPTRYKLAFEEDFEALDASEEPEKSPPKAVSENPTQTPKAVSEFPAEPCRIYGQSRVGNSDTNLVIEPVREPSVRGDAAHTLKVFEKFWAIYPKLRNRELCQEIFSQAVVGGADPDRIVASAIRFRAENSKNALMYLPYAENWLKNDRWLDYPEPPKVQARTDEIRQMAEFWTAKLKAGKFIPPSAISAEVAYCIVENGLAQEADLLRAGVQV